MDERDESDELYNEIYRKLIRDMLVVDTSLSREDVIRKCHDHYVRHAMGHRDVALAILRHNIPQKIQDLVVLEKFEPVKTDFIDHHLNEKLSDVLFRLPRKDGKGVVYYYLFEHQRKVDHWMALRDWLYKAQIIERHIQAFPDDPKIPLVFTTVLYNGEETYTAATSLLKLIDAEPSLARQMLEGYQLFDLSKLEKESYPEPEALVFLWLLRNASKIENLEILRELIENIEEAMSQLLARAGHPEDDRTTLLFIEASLIYIINAGDVKNPRQAIEVIKKALPKERGRMNNIASRLMESFREELKDEYQAKIDETKRVYEDRIGEYENKLGESTREIGEYKNKLGESTRELGEYKNKLGESTREIGKYKTKLRDAERESQERFAIKLIKNGSDLAFVSLNTDLDLAYCRKLKAMVDRGER